MILKVSIWATRGVTGIGKVEDTGKFGKRAIFRVLYITQFHRDAREIEKDLRSRI